MQHNNTPVHQVSSMKTWSSRISRVFCTEPSSLLDWTPWWMNWNTDCVPSLLAWHQWLTSLTLLWLNEQMPTAMFQNLEESLPKVIFLTKLKCVEISIHNIHTYTTRLKTQSITLMANSELMRIKKEGQNKVWKKQWKQFSWSTAHYYWGQVRRIELSV